MTKDIVQHMLTIDPEFQQLIPPLSEEEFDGLEKSILDEGFHVWEPIVTWDNIIIDGHNRYRICQEHGIEFKTVQQDFASREAAKIWIVEHQFNRRNLSRYDRSRLALTLEPLYAAEAKRRMESGRNQYSPSQISDEGTHARTDEQLAKLAGVSRDTIRKVKVIETEADKGNQTAIEARESVKSGKKSINAAYMDVRPKSDKTDTRPICTICGKPIDEGDSYDHNRFKHKSCAMRDTEDYRGSKGGRAGARLKNADYDLLHNMPTYTIYSLLNELESSVSDMVAAWSQSISINESMGVKLTESQKNSLDDAATELFSIIQKIREEADNG